MMRRLVALTSVLAVLFCSGGDGLAAAGDILGSRAPDFTGRLVSGEPFSLSRFLGKGPVILAFFSIYCKSCSEEMPALQRLHEKYGPEKVTVIAVNEDGDAGIGRVRGFLELLSAAGEPAKLSFPVFFDETGEALRKYSVVRLPTLVYIEKDGTVREFVEGFERGREYSVVSAVEKLIASGSVAPEPLREVASEAVYELDTAAPICGMYRDGKWYRPLDLDESGRPEAIARARSDGEEYLRREALKLALSGLGYSLSSQDRPPGCFVEYGMEIRTPQWRKDPLDLLMERLSFPRLLEVLSQETVERNRELVLYRRIRIRLDVLKEQMDLHGYTAAKSSIRIRFVRATRLEERTFIESVRTQFPYLSRLEKASLQKGGAEYLLISHAPAERVIENLRGLNVGPQKLSVELLPGDVAEVALWR